MNLRSLTHSDLLSRLMGRSPDAPDFEPLSRELYRRQRRRRQAMERQQQRGSGK